MDNINDFLKKYAEQLEDISCELLEVEHTNASPCEDTVITHYADLLAFIAGQLRVMRTNETLTISFER